MSAIVTLAFLHHLAAFLIVAAVMVELVIIRGELTLSSARALLRMDALYGIAALTVLVVGFLRVFYTEKGSAYYFASGPFIAKLTLFVAVGLISIYPTVQFMRWRSVLRSGQLPALEERRRRTIRMVLHLELMLLAGIILCAIMMARGVGYIG